jgi:hypothetical protein
MCARATRQQVPRMSRTLFAGMLVLGLMACSSVAAREPERGGGYGNVGHRALERTLVAGTLIEATIEGARSWRRNPLGETLTAIVTADVRNAHRWVVIPAGSPVGLRVAHWRRPTDRTQADARLTLEVLSVTVRRRLYLMSERVEVTPAPVRQPSGEVVVVAPGTRILFVLSEGFTVAKRLGGIP